MRSLLVIALVVCACGKPVADVPRPAARGTTQLKTEHFSRESVALSVPVADALHAAWFVNGEVQWLTENARGAVKVPSSLHPLGSSNMVNFDAIDGTAWAHHFEKGLFEMRDGEARSIPLPPSSANAPIRLQAVSSNTLLAMVDTRVCRWSNETWTCETMDAEKDAELESGVHIDGRQLEWSMHKYALDCFDPDPSLAILCARKGTVTELLVLENGSEVAWAHVEGQSFIVRRYGTKLLMSDWLNLTLIDLP